MFSRILSNHQSPKKCRRKEMTNVERSTIVQTSSDDEFAQEVGAKQDVVLPTSRLQAKSRSSSGSNKFVVRSTLRRTINSDSCDDEPTASLTLTEVLSDDSKDLADSPDVESTAGVIDICSSTSEASTSSSVKLSTQTTSTESLFEQEKDETTQLDPPSKRYSPIRSALPIQPRQDSVDSISLVPPVKKSHKRAFQLTTPSQQSSHPRPKSWKLTPSYARHSLSQPHSMPSTLSKLDIYSFVPSFEQVAVRPAVKQQLRYWVESTNQPSLCILHGPPGCGKRTLLKSLATEENLLLCFSDQLEGPSAAASDVTMQMALFANWVRSAHMYPNEVTSAMDQIAPTVIYVIDALPVSLDPSYAYDPKFRNDRLLFKSLITELLTNKHASGRFIWVVDTVDETNDISGIQYLLPKVDIAPCCIKMKLIVTRSLQKSLKLLFPSCPDRVLTQAIQCSRDDLRQMCLKLWIYGDKWQSSTLDFATNDPFWGLYHMIKKILLAKRTPRGSLENDFDSLFIDNRITVENALDFVDSNFVDYFGDIQDCAEILDDFVTIDKMGRSRYRSGGKGEKGGDDMHGITDRLRFAVLGYSSAVRNSRPTEARKQFSAVIPPQSRSHRNLVRFRREETRRLWIRFCEVMKCHVTFDEFILLYPTLLSGIERKTLLNIGWQQERDKLIDLESFGKHVHLLLDMNDMELYDMFGIEDDPIED